MFFIASLLAVERNLPNHYEYFYDEAGILPGPFKTKIENQLKNYEQRHGVRMHILFLQSLQGESIESFGHRFTKKVDSFGLPAVLLIISTIERKIAVKLNHQGRKLWSAGGHQRVIAQASPLLGSSSYAEGIETAIEHMKANLAIERPVAPQNRHYHWLSLVVLGLLLPLSGRGRQLKPAWFYYKNKEFPPVRSLTGKW